MSSSCLEERRSKKPGYKETKIGVIPEQWQSVLLDRIAKRGSGHTPDKKNSAYWNGDIKWVSLADSPALDRLYIDDTFATITPAGIANSSAVLHPAGTVILSRDAGVGKSAIMRTDMAVSQHSWLGYLCGPHLDNHFLYYWLQSAKPEFERIANGSTIKTIGLPYFRELKIPCPPIAEQRAIAQALCDVDALLGALDRLIAKKRDLKQTAMQQLLRGETRLPGFHDEWKVKRLGEIGQFRNGINKAKEDFGHGYPFANLMDVFGVAKVSNSSSFGLVNSTSGERDLYELRKGDVLFVRSSVKPSGVGLTTLIQEDLPNTVFSGFLLRFRDEGALTVEYKEHCFGEAGFREKLIASSTVSANTNINQVSLRALTIKFPIDAVEQTAIANVLGTMQAELAGLEQRRAKTRVIKQGMMQELLTGRTRLVLPKESHA